MYTEDYKNQYVVSKRKTENIVVDENGNYFAEKVYTTTVRAPIKKPRYNKNGLFEGNKSVVEDYNKYSRCMCQCFSRDIFDAAEEYTRNVREIEW